MHHIRNTLPDIKAKITSNLTRYQSELASLGGAAGEANSVSSLFLPFPPRFCCAQELTADDMQTQGNVILQIITEFCSEFRTAIDGNSGDLSLNELSGGARISFVFHELYSNGVKSLDPYDQVKDADIRTILYNSSVRPPLSFASCRVFSGAITGILACAFCWNYRF